MSAKKTRPAPEQVKLSMREAARKIARDHRNGKPNLAQEMERALVNAWKAGRDAAENGVADPKPAAPERAEAPVPSVKLGAKTQAVLRRYGLAAYGRNGEDNREDKLFWYPQSDDYGYKTVWFLGALDGGFVFDESVGDASIKASVKLGLFEETHLIDKDGKPSEFPVMIATPKTRPTFEQENPPLKLYDEPNEPEWF